MGEALQDARIKKRVFSKGELMAKALRQKEDGDSMLKTLWQLGSLLIGRLNRLDQHLREGLEGQFDHYASLMEKRLLSLALRVAVFFLSALLMGLGFLF